MADANVYRSTFANRGLADVRVIAFAISSADLAALRTFDLTKLDDDDANAWLYAHSEWATPPPRQPHEYGHVIRETHNGRREHYFSPAAFARFRSADDAPDVGPPV